MTALIGVMLLLLSLSYAQSTTSVESRNKKVENAIQKLVSAVQELNNKEYRPLQPSSCAELLTQGYTQSGIYTIYPKPWFEKSEITVFCDMETDGGGWTVIQRRDDFLPRLNFTENWEAYRRGFGQLNKEFWLGNDNLHILTSQDYVSLRIDLADFRGNNHYVRYDEFHVSHCHDRYRLKIGKFTGTTGDGLSRNNNSVFFTPDDDDNVDKCANLRKSGAWYSDCSSHNLNGIYVKDATGPAPDTLYWVDSTWYAVKKSEMKIRPSHFHRTPK